MKKTYCPAGCGKLFISPEHAKTHADTNHPDWEIPKRKGWKTPYGFGDWSFPITYEQACAEMKAMQEKFFDKDATARRGGE